MQQFRLSPVSPSFQAVPKEQDLGLVAMVCTQQLQRLIVEVQDAVHCSRSTLKCATKVLPRASVEPKITLGDVMIDFPLKEPQLFS